MNVRLPTPLLNPLSISHTTPSPLFLLDSEQGSDIELFLAAFKDDESYSQITPNPKAAFLPSRVELIPLIKNWCKKLSLTDRTYFLAIHYMDDIMSYLAFPKTRVHLAVLCCILLAGICFSLE